ncbi:zeta toxin family protein [Eikenella sp. S3360]|uniref:Zeta toxin family protein n=1 Tax=Eikenella glucosivorans TaxID=2766967 RepID=A0ABS0N8B6_9NEIS|nr:zeta toxin family protein [Eikenella glucosivorans]MBH5328548.1 zeta toxin family protein [Eikenella glucosivorans]
MQDKHLAIFYCGTNGAGKSTLRGFNRDSVQIVIDSDHIAMEINPQSPRSADFEAGKKAVSLFRFALEHRISFSMESTLSGHSVLQRMKSAKENGFHVRLNYVAVDSVGINLSRVSARVRLGGHFINEATIRQRFERSKENLLLALPLCDEVFVYDNSADKPELVFWLNRQKIITVTATPPAWCSRLKTELTDMGFVEDKTV